MEGLAVDSMKNWYTHRRYLFSFSAVRLKKQSKLHQELLQLNVKSKRDREERREKLFWLKRKKAMEFPSTE